METRAVALVERDAPIIELVQAAGNAARGAGSVVLLTGEAGIGKTSVVRAFGAALDHRIRLLRGGCDDMLASPPLQPFKDASRGAGGLFGDSLDGVDLDAVFAAVLHELGSRPTVLVIEDVHWADDATLDVLQYVARRIHLVPALLVLTFRSDVVDAKHPLRPLLGALTDDRVRRIALDTLTVDGVATLAAGTGRNPAEVHALTGGNPFYVIEAIAGPEDTVATTVIDAVLARIRTLDPVCERLVERLSVIPTPVSLARLDREFGRDVDSLASAEEAGILETDRATVRFRHEIARRALEQSLPMLKRRALNADLVRIILDEGEPDDISVLVHHAVEAGDSATVTRYAPLAARRASATGSHRQALAHYEAVLPFLAQLPRTERADILDEYAWELHIAHRFDDALSQGRRAVALRGDDADPGVLAETLLRLSRHLYMAGQTRAAQEAVEQAAAAAPARGADPVEAAIESYRGMFHVLTGQPETGRRILTAAAELGRASGRTDLVALCLNYLGIAACDLGEHEGLALLRESVASAARSGDHEALARGYTNLTEMLYREVRWDELAEFLDEGLGFVVERGFGSHAYNLEVHRALLASRHGDWAGAETMLEQLLESVEAPGMLAFYSMPPLARIKVRRGDADAVELLASSWQRARDQGALPGIAYAAAAYLEWAWLNERPDVASRIHDDLFAGVEVPVSPGYAEVATYLRRCGIGAPSVLAAPAPYAASLRGDWAASARAWEEADDPYERAVELAASDDLDLMTDALDVLDGLGARPAATMVRSRMRTLGAVRIPRGALRATRDNPAGLTDRQLDVFELLADGRTNAEIAESLVVSVRTVDHHVSAILGKLGVSGRREAMRVARSLGIESSRSR